MPVNLPQRSFCPSRSQIYPEVPKRPDLAAGQPIFPQRHLQKRVFVCDQRVAGIHNIVEVVGRVTSAVSCIVIKSDFFPRRVPVPGQLVRVEGETGSFVVMQVDRRRRIVQLMEKAGKHRLFDVPFESVRIFNRQLAHAIYRFLDVCEEAKSRQRS